MVPLLPQSVRSWRFGQAAVLALLIIAANAAPAAALDLFAKHEVSVEFASRDGKPMANAEVRVFAPGKPDKPVLTGKTDKDGKFEFPADTDGFWSAEAHVNDEVARVSIRVGGGSEQKELVSPIWLIGGLLVLLVLAFSYRIVRIRMARRKKG